MILFVKRHENNSEFKETKRLLKSAKKRRPINMKISQIKVNIENPILMNVHCAHYFKIIHTNTKTHFEFQFSICVDFDCECAYCECDGMHS